MKNRLGLSKQIMLILVSLSIFCIYVTAYLAYNMTKKINYDLVTQNLSTLTDSTYNLIDSAVNSSIKNRLRGIAEKNKEITKLYYGKVVNGEITKDQAINELSEILLSQHIGETGYLYVINSIGDVIIHPLIQGKNISEYEFVKNQIDIKNGYMEYMWKNPDEEIERSKALYMTYFEQWDLIISVSSYKSEFGYLVDINDFKDNLLSINIGDTGYMYVMNSSGELIIHPSQQGVNIYDSMDSSGNYFIRDMIKNKNGSIIYPWKNPGDTELRDRIVLYRYYEPMDWYLTSGVYIDELTDPINEMKHITFYVTVFILLIALVISLIYSRVILKPIKELISAMEKVSLGNYDSTINVKFDDEIGALTRIYNSMIDAIRKNLLEIESSNKMLEEANELLEHKVKERTLQLELISNQDSLTGIANRRRLNEYLEHEWDVATRENKPLSVIMLDIDFFKLYNDYYGHPKGDENLIMITKSINNSLSRLTDFVSRYGGEEFLVVLINTDEEGALEIGERIRFNVESLKIEHSKSKISKFVTVSVGVCTIYNYKDKTIKDLINKVDETLYLAKHNGRNRVEKSVIK